MAIDKMKSISAVLIENYDEIVKRLRWRVGRVVDPEDIMQDAFIKLQALSADVKIDNPRSYVLRVTYNMALDHIRHRQVQTRYFSALGERDFELDAPSPEQITDYRQRLNMLEEVIKELPARQREVFFMQRFDGLSHVEIAHRLGISRSAVEKLSMKALAKCRERLSDLLDPKS
ncbi:MAG: RNA polymerase subunit sigma-70 [Hyphomicrobiales bacterium]|nr:MAG: RNA polymerase subunit sigma-70 [Hyphomicrobiales bacterium]